MSTKIYNGIKFKSNNIYEIIHQLKGIRGEAIKVGIDDLIKNTLKPFILFKNLEETCGFDIIQKLNEDLRKEHRLLIDPCFLFEIIIFPHKTDGIFGYFITDNIQAYEDMLYNNNIAEDFHYQNQSDQPEDISDEEWEYREKVWDDLLPGSGHLTDNGMVFQIVRPDHLFHYDNYRKIEQALTKISQRLQRDKCRPYRNMWE